MNNIKTDGYFIAKVLDNINSLENYVRDVAFEDFVQNNVLLDAIMFRIVQLAENINNISQSYKEEHSNINWYRITGLRNRIVHDYGHTDYSIVFESIKNDLPSLKEELLK